MNKAMVLNTVLSATAGGVIGGIVTYLTVRKTFAERADADIQSVKERYAMLYDDKSEVIDRYTALVDTQDDPQEETPAETIDDEILKGLESATLTEEELLENGRNIHQKVAYNEFSTPAEVTKTGSVFDHDEPEPDENRVPAPIYQRIDGKPYLISEEEFLEGYPGHDPVEVTYFEGDGVLVDGRNQDIPDIDYNIGARHLDMFGKIEGSDRDTLHIRNELISVDYEVTRDPRHYTVAILGIEQEVAGAREPKAKPRKMRDHD